MGRGVVGGGDALPSSHWSENDNLDQWEKMAPRRPRQKTMRDNNPNRESHPTLTVNSPYKPSVRRHNAGNCLSDAFPPSS
jgi:hypothetical protein